MMFPMPSASLPCITATTVTPCRRQRGAVALEAALLLPLVLGVALLVTDLQRLGTERAQLEQSAGSAAITLAAQPRLTQAGVDALIDLVTLGRPQQYQVVVLNVRPSGRVIWGLRRGEGADCPEISDGRNYLGPLPEQITPAGAGAAAAADGNDDSGSHGDFSMLVVQACRNTGDITSYAGVWLPRQLQARAVNRTPGANIALDQPLTLESLGSGLALPNP